MLSPLTYRASGEVRNRQTSATSDGSAIRPSGTVAPTPVFSPAPRGRPTPPRGNRLPFSFSGAPPRAPATNTPPGPPGRGFVWGSGRQHPPPRGRGGGTPPAPPRPPPRPPPVTIA